jgi:hypothetical protein
VLLLEVVAQGEAGDVLQDHEGAALANVHVKDVDDPGVIQARQHPALLQELRLALPGEAVAKPLDHHVPAGQVRVPGAKDVRLSATAHPLDHLVLANRIGLVHVGSP